MTEWKDIPGYEGIYQVSSDGQVKSVDRIDSAERRLKGRRLKARALNSGYLMVQLCVEGVKKAHTVHKLVARAFHGESDKWVNHINGDKLDNRAENLEWTTPGENLTHAWANGLRGQAA